MSDTPQHTPATTRRRGLSVIATAVAVASLAWGGWHWMHARHFETTDNAYVAGNVVQITPQIGGTVVAIAADDTDFVKAGQPLVRLDTAGAEDDGGAPGPGAGPGGAKVASAADAWVEDRS